MPFRCSDKEEDMVKTFVRAGLIISAQTREIDNEAVEHECVIGLESKEDSGRNVNGLFAGRKSSIEMVSTE